MFKLQPRPEELLSGFLCRTARAQGASAYGFCRQYLDSKSYWARDIDRGAVRHFEAEMAAQAELSTESIRAMTLSSWLPVLSERRAGEDWPAIVPWVNAAGVLHRTRRLHGLQYCPDCLRESATVLRRWRLAFVVACPHHQRRLRDECPHCGAPWIPHRSATGLTNCHACRRSLLVRASAGAAEPDSATVRLQEAMVQTLVAASAGSDADAGAGRQAQLRKDLLGLHAMARVLLAAHKRQARTTPNESPFRNGRRRIETARGSVRYELMGDCARVLGDWPQSFQDAAQRFRLKQESFPSPEQLPEWLSEETVHLPRSVARVSHTARMAPRRPTSRLSQKLDRLELERPGNWRSLQALHLAKAALAAQ